MALKGGRRKIFGLFVMLALMLAAAAPIGVDLIDPKIKTADELEAILGFAALGVVKRGSNRPAPRVDSPSRTRNHSRAARLRSSKLRARADSRPRGNHRACAGVGARAERIGQTYGRDRSESILAGCPLHERARHS